MPSQFPKFDLLLPMANLSIPYLLLLLRIVRLALYMPESRHLMSILTFGLGVPNQAAFGEANNLDGAHIAI